MTYTESLSLCACLLFLFTVPILCAALSVTAPPPADPLILPDKADESFISRQTVSTISLKEENSP